MTLLQTCTLFYKYLLFILFHFFLHSILIRCFSVSFCFFPFFIRSFILSPSLSLNLILPFLVFIFILHYLYHSLSFFIVLLHHLVRIVQEAIPLASFRYQRIRSGGLCSFVLGAHILGFRLACQLPWLRQQ